LHNTAELARAASEVSEAQGRKEGISASSDSHPVKQNGFFGLSKFDTLYDTLDGKSEEKSEEMADTGAFMWDKVHQHIGETLRLIRVRIQYWKAYIHYLTGKPL
jgi:hypothetical protein